MFAPNRRTKGGRGKGKERSVSTYLVLGAIVVLEDEALVGVDFAHDLGVIIVGPGGRTTALSARQHVFGSTELR